MAENRGHTGQPANGLTLRLVLLAQDRRANGQTGQPANRQTGQPANGQTGKPANGKPANGPTG